LLPISNGARAAKTACQKLKSLRQLAAVLAVLSESELKTYYIRKVAEGKNKMSVLSAAGNKIVHRICAIIEMQAQFLKQKILYQFESCKRYIP